MADPEDQDAVIDWNTRKLSPATSMIEVEDYLPGHAEQSTSGRYSYKLFRSSLSKDDTIKSHRQQVFDKLELDGDPEQMLLISDINETISSNREFSLLYFRVERDPYLFATTFLNNAINTQLGIESGISNTLVFSVINMIHNETVMRRAIEPALKAELDGIKTPAELLRNNSQTTRLLTLCAKALGQSLILLVVQPVIRQILASGVSFEIDPALQPDEKIRTRNLRALCDAAADILKRVLADIPPTLISVCRITYTAIEAKFPENGWIGISNIIFLRFICSTILIPASGASFASHQKRNLVLLTKLIQAAASLKTFDSKEAFMQVTNKFLDSIIPQLSKFYKTFSAHDKSDEESLPMAMRSYLVVRKISSLTRIAEYLDALTNHPTALSQTSHSLTGRIAYHLGYRRIIFSALHDCVFIYDDIKASGTNSKITQPLERYPIEAIDMPLSIVNGVLILKVPEPVRLQFTDDEECLKWRYHIESYMQKCKLQ